MPDDRVFDAINLFKYSPIGMGTAHLGGDADYRAKYRRLARDILSRLWELWDDDEIEWVDLGRNTVGDSNPLPFRADIRVNTTLEPPSNPAAYATAASQGMLAASSCNMVHEATHLVSSIDAYPEEETLCRTIQLFYFRYLKAPRTYGSRVTGGRLTAQFLPSTPYYGDYQSRLQRLQSHDLIDSVLAFAEYRKNLETSSNAAFIARSLDWWGGLSRRWPSTRGYYLRSLASRRGDDYAFEILEILESLSRNDWQIAKTTAGPMSLIRIGLEEGHHIYENTFTERILAVQQTVGEYIAVHGPGEWP